MKILHVAETIKGGVATVLRYLATSQSSSVHNSVHCLVPAEHAGELRCPGHAVVHSFQRTGRNLGSLASLAGRFFVIVLRERPDVVHVHSTFAGVICRLVLFFLRPLHRPQVIYCPHGWSFIMDVRGWRRAAYVCIERVLLRVTDTAICVSRFEKEAAIKVGLRGEKLRVVYNGVPRSDDLVPMDRNNEGDKVRLLYIGRLDYAKGFDLLIEAMRCLPPDRFHLTVVGEAVEKKAERAPCPNVTYVGWLASDEVQAHIAASDVLVVPSRWESFCLVAAEAQVSGLAVIAGDHCSLPEIVESGRTGVLFSPHDADNLAGAILAAKPESLIKMGLEAKRVNRERFTVEEMSRLTLAAYLHKE